MIYNTPFAYMFSFIVFPLNSMWPHPLKVFFIWETYLLKICGDPTTTEKWQIFFYIYYIEL